MVINSHFYLSLAIQEAWKYQGLTHPNPAVGCTIVGENGEILSVEAHQKSGMPHAEVNALQSAYYRLTQDEFILSLTSSLDIHNYLRENHNNLFSNTSLYTTLEPCAHSGKTPSCASLIGDLGFKKVYIGSFDSHKIAQNGRDILQKSACEVISGVLEKECNALLYPFVKSLESSFVFFKWAQRLNATTDKGIISSKASRTSVHSMRNVCDLLVVGGKTVREDRPTLDARLVGGVAPDVLIYSRERDFDKSIALFSVEGREVFVSDNLDILQNYKNIMIEGGSQMYALTREIVDYYLCYIAPHFGGSESFTHKEDKFEILNLAKEERDIIMWMKRIK